MNPVLFETFIRHSGIIIKNYERFANGPPIQMYVKKLKIDLNLKLNHILYSLKLSSDTMKVILNFYHQRLWNNLETNKVVLAQWNLLSNTYQHDHLNSYCRFQQETLISFKHLIQNFCLFKYNLLTKIININH